MRYATMITLLILGLLIFSVALSYAESSLQQGNNVLLALQDYKTKESDITKKSASSLVRTDQESIRKGNDLFDKVCKVCHDAYSDTVNIIGPGLKGVLKKDVLPISKKPATAENILIQLNQPLNKMPSFHWISEEEKINIISFLNTL